MSEAASPAIGERAHSDVWARVATEQVLARGAIAVVALHVVDETAGVADRHGCKGPGR